MYKLKDIPINLLRFFLFYFINPNYLEFQPNVSLNHVFLLFCSFYFYHGIEKVSREETFNRMKIFSGYYWRTFHSGTLVHLMDPNKCIMYSKFTLFSSNTRNTWEANLDGSLFGKNCKYIVMKPSSFIRPLGNSSKNPLCHCLISFSKTETS